MFQPFPQPYAILLIGTVLALAASTLHGLG